VAPETGRISLTAAATADRQHVTLTVADNGPGIPPADRPHIFDPFFTTKDAGRGSGLGLAVAYGLMRDMGGAIDVRSDNGAVFTLTLPACLGPCQEETP
jgi:signal transduction histidine kinase